MSDQITKFSINWCYLHNEEGLSLAYYSNPEQELNFCKATTEKLKVFEEYCKYMRFVYKIHLCLNFDKFDEFKKQWEESPEMKEHICALKFFQLEDCIWGTYEIVNGRPKRFPNKMAPATEEYVLDYCKNNGVSNIVIYCNPRQEGSAQKALDWIVEVLNKIEGWESWNGITPFYNFHLKGPLFYAGGDRGFKVKHKEDPFMQEIFNKDFTLFKGQKELNFLKE